MSCLFDSLSYYIDASSYEIRQYICDYLEEGGEVMEGLDTDLVLTLDADDGSGEPAKYIRKMRMTSTWGGAIELKSTANIWSVIVRVHNIRDRHGEIIEFVPSSGKRPVGIIDISWSGSHFEPVKQKHMLEH